MKKLYILLATLMPYFTSIAQVKTTYYETGTDDLYLPHGILEVINHKMNTYKLSSGLVAREMSSYKKEEIEDHNRFGIPVEVVCPLEEDNWVEVDNGKIWTKAFESDNATSLTFVFDNFALAEGAEMYIVNGDRNVVYGPVTSASNNPNRFYMTDIIPGSKSTICLYEPTRVNGESSFTVKSIIYGYKDLLDSENGRDGIYLDPVCYPDWEDNSNGVGIIQAADGTRHGCGALVMSTDLSYKPYFLLSYRQIMSDLTAVQDWTYVFRSKRATCSHPGLDTSYTYSGAQLLAYSTNENFALIQLNGSVSAPEDLAWLGWDRSTSSPSSGSCIFEHNSILRIVFKDNGMLSGIDTNFPSGYWMTYPWDSGSFENSSFGAPYFNQSKRIVGTYCVYDAEWDLNYGWVSKYLFNMFFNAWIGDYTNTTRLSNWLDPIGTDQTYIDSHHPVGNVSIVGNSLLGDSNVYYIENLPSNLTVSWSLSDSYYDQYQLYQNTPSSNQCTITRDSNHEMIDATLTATIYQSGVAVQRLTKIVNLYNSFHGTYYNGVTTKPINLPYPLFVLPGTDVCITSPNLVGASVYYDGDATPYTWSFDNTTGVIHVGMPASGGLAIVIYVTTDIGDSYQIPILRSSNVYSMSAEIDNGQICVSLIRDENNSERTSIEDPDRGYSTEAVSWTLEVYNAMTGEKVFCKEVTGLSYIIDTTGWKPGVYIAKAIIGGEVMSEKVVVR